MQWTLLPQVLGGFLLLQDGQAFHVLHPAKKHTAKTALSVWKDKGTASYSDNWLLNFHNQAQTDYQLSTNSLTTYNEQLEREQAQIREWQESFRRNGLADFTPPMSNGLNCLMVGEGIDTPNPGRRGHFETKLPWENEAEAEITSLQVLSSHQASSFNDGGDAIDTDIVRTVLVSKPSPSPKVGGLQVAKEAAMYDCIVDHGLLGSVLSDKETVRELLVEAATALREHGIYVLTTTTTTTTERSPLSADTKALLEEYGLEAGLEWQFDLDGISDDTSQVAVARRFNNGAMPKVERKISRYQP